MRSRNFSSRYADVTEWSGAKDPVQLTKRRRGVARPGEEIGAVNDALPVGTCKDSTRRERVRREKGARQAQRAKEGINDLRQQRRKF